jgi:hypothetical protein
VYDCDFNQMLDLPERDQQERPPRTWELSANAIESQLIQATTATPLLPEQEAVVVEP